MCSSELRDGFRYAAGFAPIRALLLLLALVEPDGDAVLGADAGDRRARRSTAAPHTLGFLMSAAGLGALGGALYLASRQSVLGLGRVIAISSFVFGAGLVAFSRSTSLALSLVLLVPIGAGMMVQLAATQHAAPDPRRRGHARPRDELLRDGVLRHDPVREPARGRPRRTASARRIPCSRAGSPASSARCSSCAGSRSSAATCIPST